MSLTWNRCSDTWYYACTGTAFYEVRISCGMCIWYIEHRRKREVLVGNSNTIAECISACERLYRDKKDYR